MVHSVPTIHPGMNGVRPAALTPALIPGHPSGLARFWRKPPSRKEEFAVSDPPLALKGEALDPRAATAPFLEALGREHPLQSAALAYYLETGALVADGEFQEVREELARDLAGRRDRALSARRELEKDRSEASEHRQELEARRSAALVGAAEAFGRTGLICPDQLTSAGAETALRCSAPSEEELAGELGIAPPEPEGAFRRFASGLLLALAGAPCGFTEALALGTLLGLVRLADLQRPDAAPRLLLAALLGSAVVLLLGLLVQAAVRSAAQSREPHGPVPSPPKGGHWAAGVFLFLALLLCTAEVAAGAFGLRDLHLQRLQEMARLTGDDPSRAVLPLGVYWLIATLVSGPFVACKAARTWREIEAAGKRCLLAHRRREWIEARRADPNLLEALAAAGRAARLEAEIAALDARITDLNRREGEIIIPEPSVEETGRLDQARAAAVAQRAVLDGRIEEIVDTLDPLPRGLSRLFGRKGGAK